MGDLILQYNETPIRSTQYKQFTMYAIKDILRSIVEIDDLDTYWKELKTQLDLEGFDIYWETTPLFFDGEMQECVDRVSIFRILQSIDSPKAEQFKQWFAELAEERLEEIANPALAIERARDRYLELGYSPEWIKTRIQSIATHAQLLDEWSSRGATTKEHEKLYNTINKETFGVTVQQHKEIKNVSDGSLRDNMSPMELALVNLAELTTNELHKNNNSHGINELNKDAIEGGKTASFAREQIEMTLGKPVLTSENALDFTKSLLTTKEKAPN